MKGIMESVFRMPSGKFKACFWGKHNDHLMDWRGCNFRRVVIKGQPRKGFVTPEEARDWVMSLDDKTFALEYARAQDINGTFFGDDDWTFSPIDFKREPIELDRSVIYEYLRGEPYVPPQKVRLK